MPFWFECPICKTKRQASKQIIGRRVRCSDCNNFVEVTEPKAASDIEVDDLIGEIDPSKTAAAQSKVDEAERKAKEEAARKAEEAELKKAKAAKRAAKEAAAKKAAQQEAAKKAAVAKKEAAKKAAAKKAAQLAAAKKAATAKKAAAEKAAQAKAQEESKAAPISLSASDVEIVEELPQEPIKLTADEVETIVDAPIALSAADVEVVEDSSTANFELVKPSEEIERVRQSEIDAGFADAKLSAENKPVTSPLPAGDPSEKWKVTAAPEDEDYVEPPLVFAPKDRDEEMDMTPMVDVVFLLLIFFMVTASFTLQKTMKQPPKSDEDPSTQVVEDDQDDPEVVRVQIDQYNTYRIITADWDEEAPSAQDLRIFVRRAREEGVHGVTPEQMLIIAHADSFHEKVVTAMDIGAANNMAIQVTMTEQEF